MSANQLLDELRQNYLFSLPIHLEEMEGIILQLEGGNNFKENFNALYRKVHSLKGSGGTFGFTIISSICHQLEDFLTDEINTADNMSQDKINIIFSYIDILKDAHDLLTEGETNFASLENTLDELKQRISTPKLQALIVGTLDNLYGQICSQILRDTNIQYTATSSSITALQRLIHERFDLLITPRENSELSGTALIAAITINKNYQKNNQKIRTILITSNPKLDVPAVLAPEFVIVKGSKFSENFHQAIEKICSEV